MRDVRTSHFDPKRSSSLAGRCAHEFLDQVDRRVGRRRDPVDLVMKVWGSPAYFPRPSFPPALR